MLVQAIGTYKLLNSSVRFLVGVGIKLAGALLEPLERLAVLDEVDKFVDSFGATHVLFDRFCTQCKSQTVRLNDVVTQMKNILTFYAELHSVVAAFSWVPAVGSPHLHTILLSASLS